MSIARCRLWTSASTQQTFENQVLVEATAGRSSKQNMRQTQPQYVNKLLPPRKKSIRACTNSKDRIDDKIRANSTENVIRLGMTTESSKILFLIEYINRIEPEKAEFGSNGVLICIVHCAFRPECGPKLSFRSDDNAGSVNVRFGMVEKARRQLTLAGNANQSDPAEWQKLHEVESHLGKCMDARRIGDWKSALREADAAIANGADSSQLLLAMRSEALLRLNKLEEADSTITSLLKLDSASLSSMSTKLSGIVADSYVHVVQSQVNMAFGRFDAAIAIAEKARAIDPANAEVGLILNNMRLVARARAQGNDLFKAGKFAEASIAYGEGLKHESSNPVLYCNRAACWSKLGRWAKAVEDCNEALRIQPSYTKALLRRAASYAKLERWVDCVRDYEVLRKELPGDTEVAESLFHAQVALKTTRGEEVSNMKFGGEVEIVTSIEQVRAAIHSPGVTVLYFMATMNQQCAQIIPSVDALCSECPSVNFLKVNVDESPMIAKAENVRVVPTFKIYKDGARVKEMICPSLHVLRYSVRHYAVSNS
ncbi:TPR repeat-containing thioredoxin TTL1 [Triticum urartu]|uniref:TPR repeat-containing thioredoxin TTL1 n=1 Tax=Triticum urartu TaxID=4572 RepID=M7ZT77_TRIUA|nr:TPR repeat-containing thioredoxin TTL1 [Triticum urartu]